MATPVELVGNYNGTGIKVSVDASGNLVMSGGDISSYVDGLEALAATLNGYVDGLETLATATNALLTTQAGYLDGVEGLIGTSNTSLASILAKIIAAPATAAAQASILAALLGPRPFIVKGTINNAQTTYTYSTTPINIGGLITIATGLAPGTIITAGVLRVKVATANFTSGSSATSMHFDANPSASTFTDNTAISLHANDLAKCTTPQAAVAATVGHIGSMYVWALTVPPLTVDGSGNIYFSFNAAATLVLASTNVLAWTLTGTY